MNKKKVYILISLALIILCFALYNLLLMPTYSKDKTITFKVDHGSTITDIAQQLKNSGLIRSVNAFKIYVKTKDYHHFQVGYYQLKPDMSTKEIAYKINAGEVFFPNRITLTFKEGSTLLDMASTLGEKTNYSSSEILEIWNSDDYLNEVIARYDFISKDIKDPSMKYSLNGYFFPETYFFADENVSPEEVGHRMLQRMETVLDQHASTIKNSHYSVHEILTLASIVEYEAKTEEDRPIIAGVFINRLKNNMKLESCATLEMATGIHKERYKNEDIKVNSPYNTYIVNGLPIGPGNCPGELSIKAVLYPQNHDYYFFLSDIYGDSKVYYAKTLSEHNKLKNKYLQ
ncbi:MAG: endolytic transglycosylase MltG [Eubacteriales bacterium]